MAEPAPEPAVARPSVFLDTRAGGTYVRRVKPIWESLAIIVCLPLVLPVLGALVICNARALGSFRSSLMIQTRVGQDGCRFGMLKLRTLTVTPDGRPGPATRFGAWLRRTHLDELPQLWNVLQGQMSLVGPRPELPDIDQWARKRLDGYARRLEVRPGMTGVAQIRQGYARVELNAYRTKLEHDLRYLEVASLWQDLRLVFCAAFVVVRGRGDRARARSMRGGDARIERPVTAYQDARP